MFGQSSFQVNNNNLRPTAAPAPPFDPTSAYNGLSIDAVTGQIVLGQDLGTVGDPAIFVNSRQIPNGGNDFIVTNPLGQIEFTISGAVGSFQSMLVSADLVSSVILNDGFNGNQANLEANNGLGTVFVSVGADGLNGHFNISAPNQLNYFLNFNDNLVNHAGALAGTLNNSPVAGDPVKWIGINDNGVLRRIPTW